MGSVSGFFPGNRPTARVEVSLMQVGFGPYLEGMWFTGSWMFSQREQSIAYKELFPVVIAAHVRGHQWCRRHVLFRWDNDSVLPNLNARTSKVLCLMHLLRTVLLAAARHSFSFSAWHIPGVNRWVYTTRNWCHHCKLRWNSLLRWIGWSFLLKQHNISIIRGKKVRPGHTTFAAWWTLAPVCCTMSG